MHFCELIDPPDRAQSKPIGRRIISTSYGYRLGRRFGQTKGYTRMSNTYVVDGMNVCWWSTQPNPKAAPSIQPLLTVLVALLENGDDFYCVFDASITHAVGVNEKRVDASSIETMLESYPDRFFRVTGATRADGVILHDADHYKRSIITNDIYRDYREKYQWLSDKYTGRLVQGNLQPSGLMTLEKLPYGQLSLLSDTELALNRLYELLAVRTSPEITEVNRQLQLREQSLVEINERVQERETQLSQLIEQIGGLEGQKLLLSKQITRHKPQRIEVDSLTIQLNETRAKLEALYGIRDFDDIEKEMQSKLEKLKSDILSLDVQYQVKKQKYANLQIEANQYQSILNQKKKSEDDLRDDHACIRKAKTALEAFLEPYPARFGRPNQIPFDGSTWDSAVKKLQIFLDKNKVCTHCYGNGHGLAVAGRVCISCHKGVMTDKPKDLWQLVLGFAPQ